MQGCTTPRTIRCVGAARACTVAAAAQLAPWPVAERIDEAAQHDDDNPWVKQPDGVVARLPFGCIVRATFGEGGFGGVRFITAGGRLIKYL